jgi:exodeoxyribonuclease VII small subunit
MTESKSIEKLSYEKAFEELEKIVSSLEDEQKNLDDSLALFERGQALSQHCAKLLDSAELKVQQLTEDGTLENFEE